MVIIYLFSSCFFFLFLSDVSTEPVPLHIQYNVVVSLINTEDNSLGLNGTKDINGTTVCLWPVRPEYGVTGMRAESFLWVQTLKQGPWIRNGDS